MENYITLVLLFVTGYGLRRVKAFPAETAKALNLFVIYVPLPALILHKVHGLTLDGDAMTPIVMPWAILALSALIVNAASRIGGWDRKVTGALMLVVPLGNTSFLGIPMVTNFLGEQQVRYALLYDQLGTFLALSTYGTYVLAYYGAGSRPRAWEVIRKILAFPPFIALVIAVLTGPLEYPRYLGATFAAISASLVPVVMVAIGFQLRVAIDRQHMAPLAVGLAVKLGAAPMAALGACHALGMTEMAAKVSILESGMPPMVTAGALAIMGGLSEELTAATVGFGLMLSFATLPILNALIKTL